MSARKSTTPFGRLLEFLGSYGLCIALLFCLFILTLFGTLDQVDNGLYLAKKRFFESWFLWADLGAFSVPTFPGGVTCMLLLSLNMLVGGLVRIRWSARTAGVIVIHIGMAALLFSGAYKFAIADEGNMRLFEQESAQHFESYNRWEVAVWQIDASAEIEQYVIGHDLVADLEAGGERSFSFGDLPFELVLSNFVVNCQVQPRGPMWTAVGPDVEGYGLLERPREKEAEFNIAGLHAAVTLPSGEVARGLLYGWGEVLPWTFSYEGRAYAVDLRHERYHLPFRIELEDFQKEDHPGTGMAKAYRSFVQKIEGDSSERVLIQMNEPLRHGDYVLYQSSWGPSNARPGEPLFSVFSVVFNPSDKWPEYSLWVITLGLLMAFGRKLVHWLKKQMAHSGGTPPAASDTGTKR